MTTRLYYTDSLLRTFDATVVVCERHDDRYDVVVDRTAFYPASGGQPFDTGTLGGARVVDVIDREDGAIVHVTAGPLTPGGRVSGEIDWPRRFDHMQQHTGQHILSAAFDRLFGARTMSFHLGSGMSTIDLVREVSAGEIGRAEEAASQVVWDDRAVAVRFASAAEAASLPLRKESQRTGELRLVEVPNFDLSACGGTHVPRTGMVGLIAVAGWERFKGASRVSFLCGGRALASHARLRDTVTAAARQLAASSADLSDAIERQQRELKAAGKSVDALEEELARLRADALRTSAEDIGGRRVVLTNQPAAAAGLKRLASEIVRAPGFVAILTGDGQPTPVVAARSADVAFDAGAWLRRATEAIGGRGGGRPEQAQGGIPAPAERILAFARESLVTDLRQGFSHPDG